MADGYYSSDFEFEEPIRISRPPLKKKKRKVCVAETEFDEATEAQLSECVDKCQEEISQINGEEEMSSWGVQVFGNQEKLSQLEYSELGTSILMRSFVTNEIYKRFAMNIEKDIFLLLNNCSSLLYSPKIRLMEASGNFWHAIMVDSSRIKVDWLPRYEDLKRALQAYGFLLDSIDNISSDVDMVAAGVKRCWVEDQNSEAFKLHRPRIYEDLWIAEDCMKMLVLHDCPGNLEHWYQHTSKGGWPFSIADNGWPTSDSIAKGLKFYYYRSDLKNWSVNHWM